MIQVQTEVAISLKINNTQHKKMLENSTENYYWEVIYTKKLESKTSLNYSNNLMIASNEIIQ